MRNQCSGALVSACSGVDRRFELAGWTALALDSGSSDYGRRLLGKCGTMRPVALLSDRTDLLDRSSYVVLAEFGVVPLPPGIFLDALLVATVLACLAELPLGKYRIKT